jgi:hypothetical protein
MSRAFAGLDIGETLRIRLRSIRGRAPLLCGVRVVAE